MPYQTKMLPGFCVQERDAGLFLKTCSVSLTHSHAHGNWFWSSSMLNYYKLFNLYSKTPICIVSYLDEQTTKSRTTGIPGWSGGNAKACLSTRTTSDHPPNYNPNLNPPLRQPPPPRGHPPLQPPIPSTSTAPTTHRSLSPPPHRSSPPPLIINHSPHNPSPPPPPHPPPPPPSPSNAPLPSWAPLFASSVTVTTMGSRCPFHRHHKAIHWPSCLTWLPFSFRWLLATILRRSWWGPTWNWSKWYPLSRLIQWNRSSLQTNFRRIIILRPRPQRSPSIWGWMRLPVRAPGMGCWKTCWRKLRHWQRPATFWGNRVLWKRSACLMGSSIGRVQVPFTALLVSFLSNLLNPNSYNIILSFLSISAFNRIR